jgi:DNA-binding SARP family transcriptional activator
VLRGDRTRVVFARRKSLAVLARLAVVPGDAVPRATLSALLWGGVGTEQAVDSFRHVLTDVRHALGRDAARILRTEGETVALDPDAVDVDVAAFRRHANDPAGLDAAVRLYAGDFLAGLELREPAFDAWRARERQRLRALATGALSTLVTRHTAADAWPQATAAAVRLLELEPLDEATHRALMRLYAAQGQRAAALRQYQACVTALARELASEPGAETKAAYREILTSEAPAAARAAAPEAPLLVGRDAELATMSAALEKPARAFVWTVVGEAGIGKTALMETLLARAV